MACRIIATGLVLVRSTARKVFAIAIGRRSRAPTDFMFCLIRPIANRGCVTSVATMCFGSPIGQSNYAVISPDSSRNEPDKTRVVMSGAEVYGVVYSLSESPNASGNFVGRNR